MTTKNRITVNLEDNEYKALQKVAKQTDRSLAWLGRKAIYDFLSKTEESNNQLSGFSSTTTPAKRKG